MTAAEKILRKSLVGSSLNSEAWNSIQAGLRDRAFFSATVENIRVLAEAQRMCAEIAVGRLSSSEMRRDMRKVLSMAGHPEGDGGVTDLHSKRRLDLIIETNVRQARGYAQYMEGTTDGALEAFPAQELIRVRERKAKRDWARKWRDAGGRLFRGRMVALKTDPVWGKISRFGTPYPPFDFNSGMGVEDIDRDEAIELGVLKADDPPQHVERTGFNDGLATTVPFNGDKDDLWLDLKDKFGDQITNNGSEIRWRTESIHESFEKHTGFRMNCGKASEKMLQLGGETAEPFRGRKLVIDDNWLQREDGHGYKHFKPVENHPEDIVLTEGDLDLIPEAWRNPDRVTSGGTAGTVICELDTLDGGTLHLVAKQRNVSKRIMRLATMYKTKK